MCVCVCVCMRVCTCIVQEDVNRKKAYVNPRTSGNSQDSSRTTLSIEPCPQFITMSCYLNDNICFIVLRFDN